MEFKDMEMTALEQRIAAIKDEAQVLGESDEDLEKLEALKEERTKINQEIEARRAAEAERRKAAEEIEKGAGTEMNEAPEERTKHMDNMEIRNTKQYIDAYAEYIKTGKDEEVRSLLTENVSGQVPVPEFVYDIVKTAWERDGITRLVKKSYVRGNLKVGFEISASGATVHTEGQAGPSEEALVLGIINLIPKNIKKWISVSDEALSLRGESFLRYIYDELTYQIAKKAAEELLDKIIACGTVSTNTPTSSVAVPKITSTTLSVSLVAQALGQLSDEAANPVVVLNKSTWAAIKAAQAANQFNYDPFEGLPVVFNNHITAFSAATTGVTYMLVGDFEQGALANFPEGEEIKFTFDDITLATDDMVKIIGKEYVAIAPVAPYAFAKVTK